jgi:Ca-activated chloride channel family protein
LVLFSSKVTVVVPIAEFNLTQKAAFHAAVEDIRAGGRTAMYDGIAVALSLLLKEKENNPQAKPMLFVLTDGETGQGLSFKTIRPVIEGIRIPIYTIGYDANLPVLREVSSIVEAASINADQGDVEYKIGSLLNAQM